MIEYLAYHATKSIQRRLEVAADYEKATLRSMLTDIELWQVQGNEEIIVEITKMVKEL